MRGLPFFKPKNKPQFAGLNFSDTSSGGGGSIDTSALANKTDLTAIILTGTTNTSGSTITAGTWFYLNRTPCIAKVDIASGATFTEGTNYEEKTVGSALSELNSKIKNVRLVKRTGSGNIGDNLLEIASYYDNLSDSEKRRAFINVEGFGEAHVYSPGEFFSITQNMSLLSVTIYTISGNAIQSNMNSDGTNKFYDYRQQIAVIELYV